MSDHYVILKRNIFYTLRHLLRFGMPKAKAISKIAKESAEIIGANDLGKIKPGIISSLIVWNSDPFSLDSYLSRQLQREKLYIRNSYFNFKT